MRAHILAGLFACLTVSVSAGGAGGSSGGYKLGANGSGGTGGTGGSVGAATAGAAQSGNGGATGNVGGSFTGTTGGGGDAAQVLTGVSAPVGATVNYGTIGAGSTFGPTIGGGHTQGGPSGSNSPVQNYAGVKQTGGSTKAVGGSTHQGSAGSGAQGGSPTQMISGTTTGGGGTGGGVSIPVQLPPIPVKRSMGDNRHERRLAASGPTTPLTDQDIIKLLQQGSHFPSALDAELQKSWLKNVYYIPKLRRPCPPEYASRDVTAAVAELKNNKIPKNVMDAINKAWKKQGPAPHYHGGLSNPDNVRHALDKKRSVAFEA